MYMSDVGLIFKILQSYSPFCHVNVCIMYIKYYELTLCHIHQILCQPSFILFSSLCYGVLTDVHYVHCKLSVRIQVIGHVLLCYKPLDVSVEEFLVSEWKHIFSFCLAFVVNNLTHFYLVIIIIIITIQNIYNALYNW